MAAVSADATATRGPTMVRGPEAPAVIRCTLGLIGAAQVLIAIPALAGNDTGATLHVAHEAGAWSLALAAALAMAAWRPARAAALLPFLAVFVGTLAALTVGDIAAGRVAPSAELPHLMAGFGLLLLWLESHPPTGIGHAARPAPRGERVAA
jgi:predicted anti-sigma-YlaC factor YlaD